MAIKIGHASQNENGVAYGGTPGDQTDREVCESVWYKDSWHTVLRPKSNTVANGIAKACKAGCANDKIGYNMDTSKRLTLYTQAQKVGFDLSKITTACECDCSSFVAVCVNAAGVSVSSSIATGNMVSALQNTGAFDKLTDSKYLTSDTYLQTGDIVVKSGHTFMVLGDYNDGLDGNMTAQVIGINMAPEHRIIIKIVGS